MCMTNYINLGEEVKRMIDWKFGYFNYKDKTASIKIIITY